ncbi:hypothetical protein [Frankia sp. AvcI1]|uniref:hypothetical protein n=1 Tax=Frankia sp. AvcI1 TaxID=573496 RepID=UPI002119AF09|nr:hypothetical protein [Frankia sp. AvcI1]
MDIVLLPSQPGRLANDLARLAGKPVIGIGLRLELARACVFVVSGPEPAVEAAILLRTAGWPDLPIPHRGDGGTSEGRSPHGTTQDAVLAAHAAGRYAVERPSPDTFAAIAILSGLPITPEVTSRALQIGQAARRGDFAGSAGSQLRVLDPEVAALAAAAQDDRTSPERRMLIHWQWLACGELPGHGASQQGHTVPVVIPSQSDRGTIWP